MFWFEMEHPETGEALEVEAVYWPLRRGDRDSFGVPLEPDDDEAVCICEVRDRAGRSVVFKGFEEAIQGAGLAFARELDTGKRKLL